MPDATSKRGKPLDGLRVLDLSRLLPGPLATRHLADYGADVIKIEDTGAGDYARTMGAMNGDTSFLYQLLNRNKRSLRIDLKKSAGRALFLRLAQKADVIVEGFRPGVMEKLGLGFDVLAEANPRLVLCSITGYGQTGPYAQRAGHDLNYIGYAGVLDQIGTAGAGPAIPNLQVGDLLGGTLTALFGLLVAIIDARSSGRGRHVDVAMTEATLAHAIFPWVEVLAHGQVRPRGEDLLTGAVPCYGVYETADGRHMAVAALEEKFWELLCETVQRPDLKPFHLATGPEGERARAELAAIFRSRTRDEWVSCFDSVDCCVSPVLRLEECLQDAQVLARKMVTGVGRQRQPGPPVRLSDFELGPCRPAPAAGQDADELLAALGLGATEIARLRAEGVI